MDEIDNVKVIYHLNETLIENEVNDIDEIHHVNENKDMGMELTKLLKMIKYVIWKSTTQMKIDMAIWMKMKISITSMKFVLIVTHMRVMAWMNLMTSRRSNQYGWNGWYMLY